MFLVYYRTTTTTKPKQNKKPNENGNTSVCLKRSGMVVEGPSFLMLRSFMQEGCEFEYSLGYMVRSCLGQLRTKYEVGILMLIMSVEYHRSFTGVCHIF